MKADVDLLPEPHLRFPMAQLRGHVGKRSAHVITLPGDVATMQAALNALTGYGDTIRIAASYTETMGAGQSALAPPDTRAWTVDASTPRCLTPPGSFTRAAMAARAAMTGSRASFTREVQGEPSYVLITTDAALPEIGMRRLTLPTGEVVPILDEAAKVNETHYPLMPTLQMGPASWYLINCGFSIAWNRVTSRFAWRGIHFLGSTNLAGDSPCFFWLAGQDTGQPNVWHRGRGENLHQDHWIFNQCAWEADPLNRGTSVGTVVDGVPPWFAMVNCFADKLWTMAGGDGKLFAPGLGPGHVENNDIRGGCGAMWFTGGGGSQFVDDGPDNWFVRRNWYYAPLSWLPSEPHPNSDYQLGGGRGGLGPYGTITVNISAGGVMTSSDGNEWQGNNPEYNPVRPWSIFYELATGRARQVASLYMHGGQHYTGNVTLNEPWPGGAASNLIGVCQYAHPDAEISPTLYNSGLKSGADPMPTATINSTTRHIALSEALPQYVADEVAAGHFPFFYPNWSYWQAWNGDPPPINLTQDVKANGWGYQTGVTYAQSIRKKIVAVDPDHRGMTFDATQDVYTATQVGYGATFPYSIVRADGLRRHVLYHNKGSFENKTGHRWVMDGNVHDVGWYNNRVYALDQTWAGVTGWVTIAGDTATLLAGTPYSFAYEGGTLSGTTPSSWPAYIQAWAGQGGLGSPWYNVGLFPANSNSALEYCAGSRWIDRVLSATTARLHRQDPRWPTGQLGDGTWQNMFWVGTAFPWCSIGHTLQRYNILNGGSPITVYAESAYESKVIPGGQVAVHNNLYLRGQGTQYSMNTVPAGPPQGGGPSIFSPGGQAVYDEPPVSGKQGHWRFDHNTAARPHHGVAGAPAGIIMGAAVSTMPAGSDDISFSDNLCPGANGTFAPFVKYPDAQEASNAATSWNPATTRAERNVIAGNGTLDLTFGRWSLAASNSRVTEEAAVGLPNYANGALDGYTLSNYALGPIYTGGTVSIDATGLVVTHDSTDFPDYVQATQWFKTTTSGVLRKITVAGGPLGILWSTYAGAHAFVKRNGIARPIGGGAPMAFQTHTQALGNDQWVQATNVSGTLDFNLGIRCGAPETVNGYACGFVPSGYYGGSIVDFILYRIDNGTVHVLSTDYAWGPPSPMPANAVIRLEISGTALSLTVNGTAGVSHETAADAIKYSSGRAGLVNFANVPSTTISTWSCGNVGSAASAADNFSGGANQIQLTSAYPETNVAGKAFAITFQGTASDGTDPGADLATLAAFVQGVRNPARAHF